MCDLTALAWWMVTALAACFLEDFPHAGAALALSLDSLLDSLWVLVDLGFACFGTREFAAFDDWGLAAGLRL